VQRQRSSDWFRLCADSGIESAGTFYTDSNGREMVKRQRDARGPSYPKYVVGEPVAGNYYPVNSMISLDDGKNEMAVVIRYINHEVHACSHYCEDRLNCEDRLSTGTPHSAQHKGSDRRSRRASISSC
jgi:hypothetical protein